MLTLRIRHQKTLFNLIPYYQTRSITFKFNELAIYRFIEDVGKKTVNQLAEKNQALFAQKMIYYAAFEGQMNDKIWFTEQSLMRSISLLSEEDQKKIYDEFEKSFKFGVMNKDRLKKKKKKGARKAKTISK